MAYDEDEFRKELEAFDDKDDEDDEDDIFKEEKDDAGDELFGAKTEAKPAEVEEKPARFRCLDCRNEFTTLSATVVECPKCSGIAKMISDDTDDAPAAKGKKGKANANTKGNPLSKSKGAGKTAAKPKKPSAKPAKKTAAKVNAKPKKKR